MMVNARKMNEETKMLNYLKEKIPPTSQEIQASSTTSSPTFSAGNFEMPAARGLRLVLLRMFFQHLSVFETLKMRLVCKEWLQVAQSEELWKFHLKSDFPFLFSKKEEDIKAVSKYGPFQLAPKDNYVWDPSQVWYSNIQDWLSSFEEQSGDHSFLQYWKIRNEIFIQQSFQHFRVQKSMQYFLISSFFFFIVFLV